MEFHMHDHHDVPEYTNRERELFAALPRAGAVDPAVEARVVAALRVDGYFRPRDRRVIRAVAIAAGLLLFAIGGIAGAFFGSRYAMRNSLETLITRRDLPVVDRVLLLQRAGSAYVRAAHGYADATARADSTAVEVASQVLVGAAQAMARSRLDSRVAVGLTAVLQRGAAPGTTTTSPSILWF
jgi:hypothetical protein